MAEVFTVLEGAPVPFPYTGVSDPFRRFTNVPVQEIRFSASGTIAATGAGDNQVAIFRTRTPDTYAVALMDAYFMLRTAAGAAVNFIDQGNGRIVDQGARIPFELLSQGANRDLTTGDPAKLYSPRQIPDLVVKPVSGSDTQFDFGFYNSTSNDVAYTLEGMVRVLLFNIDQAHHAAVNTPQLVRG